MHHYHANADAHLNVTLLVMESFNLFKTTDLVRNEAVTHDFVNGLLNHSLSQFAKNADLFRNQTPV